jgi:molybdopterin synthase catalytic subunit
MRAVRVVGSPAERRAAADRLVERLADEGSVAVVASRKSPVEPAVDPPGADAAYALAPDGVVERGGPSDLEAVLDRIAVEHDYAVVVGRPDAVLPVVVVGNREPREGTVLHEAADAAAVDVDAAAAALAGTEPVETLESLVAAVEADPAAERAGAIATFTGRVRAKDGDDDVPTERLEFEKYEGVADERLATIREQLADREGVLAVRLYHRTGVVEAGERIVHVVVLAGHRGEAFRTVEDGIDRLKEEVPIFKKEVTAEGDFWVHDRP